MSQALAFRTKAFREALASHWDLGSRIGGHWASFHDTLVASRIIRVPNLENYEEMHKLANWAKHAPPPGIAAPQVVPATATTVVMLEQVRAELLEGAAGSEGTSVAQGDTTDVLPRLRPRLDLSAQDIASEGHQEVHRDTTDDELPRLRPRHEPSAQDIAAEGQQEVHHHRSGPPYQRQTARPIAGGHPPKPTTIPRFRGRWGLDFNPTTFPRSRGRWGLDINIWDDMVDEVAEKISRMKQD